MITPNSNLCPEITRQAIDSFANYGIPPGHFVQAILCNDLLESVVRADATNMEALPHIVAYCYNCIPGTCWGSPEKFFAWMKFKQEERARNKELSNDRSNLS